MTGRPIRKLLIANRGEIACRVIRTARRMGIGTVAVYSDADARAVHVSMADEAVRIGAAPAAESYLGIDAIVAACRTTGADAVHPGYGFLSENAAFARALDDAGIVFVGPPVRAIEVMGDKIESKRFAARAGVNIVPGYDGAIDTPDNARKVAGEIGLPVMLKASAGGGGKGMRIAETLDAVPEAFERARSEARSSFGDERILIERFVTDPRHIEIQVLADGHGNAIHLGERECSIQRRNQKVIEEAPSAFLDEDTRAQMGAQAVALAKACEYVGAGTVEFIVDGERRFYFLEMNTRLQVEHPVTELVTGTDLVEQQLRVAMGEPLAIEQTDVRLNGSAIEARVYAEDAVRGFVPSTGRLVRYRPPKEDDGQATVRVDDGVVEGSDISIYYDPMIAKLCTWAPTRDEATDAMARALDGYEIDGITSNLPFLSALIAHPRWRNAELTTKLIEEEFPDGFTPEPFGAGRSVAMLIALSCELDGSARHGVALPDGPVSFLVGGERIDGSFTTSGDVLHLRADCEVRGHAVVRERSIWSGTIDREAVTARAHHTPRGWRIERGGREATIRVLRQEIADLVPIMPLPDEGASANELRCPMPGTLIALHASPGQTVAAGDALAIVEAMKMENVLRAERDGTVGTVEVEEGDGLAVDQLILTFEAQ